ncbi:MAG: response regulator [Opitutaceae bacterium]|nr:response regulator [Opitutaceae bacterium]
MSKTRILVVEDEAIVARDLTQQLTRLGYEPVASTPSGEEALTLVAQLRPDLVLMDIQLAGELDGIATAITVREQFATPVVFLTAFADDTILQRSKQAEPFGYIVKPFEERELYSVVEISLHKYRAESRLRQSQQELATILRTAMDGFWVNDTEGRIIEVNEAMCRLLGYTREEMIGLPIPAIEINEAAADVAAHIAKVRRDGADRFETRHRRKDGRVLDVEASLNYLPTSGGRIFCFLRDITERKRADDEREATMRLLRLVNAPSDTHGLMKAVTSLLRDWSGCEAVGIRLREGEDFPYFETSGFPDSFVEKERFLCQRDAAGQPVRDSAGHPVLECMCGNILCGRFDATKPFFTAHGSFWTNSTTALLASTTEADRQARTRNRCHGEGYESVALVPLRIGGATHGLLQFNDKRCDRFTPERIALLERLGDSLAIAISQRQTQAALRASEAKFATTFQAAPLMIALTSLDDGTYLEVNNEFVRATGFTREEVLGRTSTTLSLIATSDRARMLELLRREGRLSALPLPVTIKSGARLECLFSAEIVDIGGQPRLLSIALDTTDHRRLEAQLRQAQKMEAVGQLAGGVAHDFNNILAAIALHLGLLRDAPDLDAETRASLRELEKEAARGAGLTRQLLTFSRQQAMQVKPLLLNEVLENLLKMLRRVLGEGIAVEFRPQPDLPAVEADVGMLEQVVVNLCVNARDAMPNGGRLLLATDSVSLEGIASAPSARPRSGQFVRLSISDTGCGMNTATLSRIFEPFFTTKEVGQGTGLGLAIVDGIVKQHDGWVEVESTVGVGTTFRILFPAKPRPVKTAAPQVNDCLPRGHNELLLVVEDELSVRTVLSITLRRYGYRVHLANNGREALDLWATHRTEIDLVLTDMVLPGGMSGTDLIRQFHADRPELPVILASGYMRNQDGLTLPGVTALPKPFEMQALLSTLRRCLDTRRPAAPPSV